MSSQPKNHPHSPANTLPLIRSTYPAAAPAARTSTASLAARVWFASLCVPGILACTLALL